MTSPRVTVITIFHDPGPHLAAAIDSVLRQTCDDLEYVLVDDGSTDGASERARQVAAAHPDRVRYLDHPGHARRGMSASRNAGLRAARGPLVAFLDADDVWLPDALERQLAVLDRHPEAAMVVGATVFWHSWDPSRSDADVVHRVGPVGPQPPPSLAPRMLDQTINPPSMNAWVGRRDAVVDVGGFEEGFPGLFEDQVFLFKFLLAHPVVVHDQVVDRYRQHRDSACAQGLASGEYALDAPSRARLAFRAFARRHLAAHGWRGTAEYRTARRAWLVDRYPRTARLWKRVRPRGLRAALRRRRWDRETRPPVDLGPFRHGWPFSDDYGYDRGRPVDRHYIEAFCATWGDDVRGRVLEVGEDTYTRRFGRDVDHVDVLHVDPTAPGATVVADLADAPQVPDATYDCVVITQTLQLIGDIDAAVAELHRIVAPGGVVLATVPAISRMTDDRAGRHHWNLTQHSAQRLFGAHFDDVVVEAPGNVLAATAFLFGLADHELPAELLRRDDPRFPVVVTVRARRAET